MPEGGDLCLGQALDGEPVRTAALDLSIDEFDAFAFLHVEAAAGVSILCRHSLTAGGSF
jgi:hypothetical protein